jgi:hypothetical protein
MIEGPGGSQAEANPRLFRFTVGKFAELGFPVM